MAEGGFLAGSIVSKLLLDKTQFDSAVLAASARLETFSKSAQTSGDKLKSWGDKTANAGKKLSMVSLPILGVGAAMAKSAMDAVESENLFEVSMGGLAGQARQWSNEMSKALGINQYELRKNVATFNVMLGSMGLGQDKAYGMAKGMTQLSYDMASFYNLKPEEAFQKLQAGISGEIEPLKRLGIIVNDNTIQQWALTNGLIKQGQTMTDQQKIQARYNVIMEATKKAQGDLARTLDSPTNKMRLLWSRVQELSVTFGQLLIPVVDKLVTGARKLVDWISNLDEGKKKLILTIGGLLAVAGPVVLIFGKVASAIGSIINVAGLAGEGMAKIGLKAATLGPTLAKVGAAGVAAFVGWQIGRAIADLLGLDKAIEGTATKVIDFLGLYKGLNAEYGTKHADLAAKQTLAIQGAMELAGVKARNYNEAINALEAVYKKAGTTGNAELDKLVRTHITATGAASQTAAAVGTTGNAYNALKVEGASLADQTADLKKELGLTFTEDIVKQIKAHTDALATYGKLMPAEAVQALKDKIEELRLKLLAATPIEQTRRMQEFGQMMAFGAEQAATLGDDVAYTTIDLSDMDTALGYLEDKFGVTKLAAAQFQYELLRIQLAGAGLAGIRLPDINWEAWEGPSKKSQDDTRKGWDNVFSDLSSKWGSTIQNWMQGSVTFKDFLGNIWGDVKTTFFRVIGDMVAKWMVDFVGNIIKGLASTAASTVATNATMAASTAATSAGMAASVGGLVTAAAAGITAVISAVASGIVAIAGAIAGAIVALASGIASAATILAAAAPAILAVGAIALALYAGFSLITKLFGGGGSSPEVTWLKKIYDKAHGLLGWALDDNRFQMNEVIFYTQYTTQLLENLRDQANAIIQNTANIVAAIAALPHAAAGAVVNRPSLMMVGENAPREREYIIPQSQVGAFVEQQGGGGRLNLSINGVEVPLDLSGRVRNLLIKLVPELTKKEALLIHPVAVRSY